MSDGGPSRSTDQLPILRSGANFRALIPAYYNNAYILVPTSNDPVLNGVALLAAYDAAKALTPNGLALSSTNRAVVLLPPGRYDLVDDGLILDTNFVDVIGLSTSRRDAYITSACADGDGFGTITHYAVAPDVVLANFTVNNTGGTRTDGDGNDTAAYFVDDNAIQVRLIKNVEFLDNNGASWAMRQAREYAGTYENCVAADYSFGAHGGSFTGTAVDCRVGIRSFGNGGSFDGIATRCTGGNYCFAAEGTVGFTAMLDSCVAGTNSFAGGAGSEFRGTAVDCRAGDSSFGYAVVNGNAQFYRCTAGTNSFGYDVHQDAYFEDCRAASGFGITTCRGIFKGCISYGDGFGSAGTIHATARLFDCLAFGAGFGGIIEAGAVLKNCTAGDGGFGHGEAMGGELINPTLLAWVNAWAPSAFTGKVSNAIFSPSGTDKDAATMPDGATGAFEFCTFRKTGTGTPLGLASGSATINISYCKFNTAGGIAAGITNGLGATLALAFNIGNTAV